MGSTHMQPVRAVPQSAERADVRFGSVPEVTAALALVRFVPYADLSMTVTRLPKRRYI
jgi:hypothetical protein